MGGVSTAAAPPSAARLPAAALPGRLFRLLRIFGARLRVPDGSYTAPTVAAEPPTTPPDASAAAALISRDILLYRPDLATLATTLASSAPLPPPLLSAARDTAAALAFAAFDVDREERELALRLLLPERSRRLARSLFCPPAPALVDESEPAASTVDFRRVRPLDLRPPPPSEAPLLRELDLVRRRPEDLPVGELRPPASLRRLERSCPAHACFSPLPLLLLRELLRPVVRGAAAPLLSARAARTPSAASSAAPYIREVLRSSSTRSPRRDFSAAATATAAAAAAAATDAADVGAAAASPPNTGVWAMLGALGSAGYIARSSRYV